MSKRIVLKNKEEIERHIESLRLSAEESQFKIDEISSHSNPLEFLRQIKFEKLGFDPLDAERPLNFIEQVNQTFTYFASFKAAGYLFDRHKGIDSLTLNLGTRSGSDIESSFDGGIAAEVFAAVHPNNNKKLQKDIEKVSLVEAQYKYVFFICPDIEEGQYFVNHGNGVVVWSLGNE